MVRFWFTDNEFHLLQIDQAALTQQIEEKKAREEEQRKIDKAFDEQCIYGAKLALFLENKIEEVMYLLKQSIKNNASNLLLQCID